MPALFQIFIQTRMVGQTSALVYQLTLFMPSALSS